MRPPSRRGCGRPLSRVRQPATAGCLATSAIQGLRDRELELGSGLSEPVLSPGASGCAVGAPFALPHQRRCKGLVGGPAFLETLLERSVRNARFLGPVSHALGLALPGDELVVSAITAIPARSDPADIPRFVPFFVVDPVQLVSPLRLWRDIGVKPLKRFPCRSDFNSSSTVMVKALVVWVGASVPHVSPDVIDGSAFHSMRGSPLSRLGAVGAGRLFDKIRVPGLADATAIAPVRPPPGFFADQVRRALGPANNYDGSKALPCAVYASPTHENTR